MEDEAIEARFAVLEPFLDERMRRLVCAAEAHALGRGGVTRVARATGVSRRAIHAGLEELETEDLRPPLPKGRVRRSGAGRKPLVERDPELERRLEALIEPATRGDPESALRWTCKSVRRLAKELSAQGHPVSYPTVAQLLHGLDYSLQANVKTREGAQHPDRNAQFEHLHRRVQERLGAGEPVLSVDTKKKLVGDFKNGGREWRPQGQPEPVRVHDFAIPELGRATPYGVYDVAHNTGLVRVGIDHDTAAFAVESIRRWWYTMGRPLYPTARRLLIVADGGGSNGSRVRLWKVKLQELADETGLAMEVCHLPPGTSKWNRIEHRLFCFISINWRGQPLVNLETIVQLIAATTNETGLTVRCELDPGCYPLGIQVPDAAMAELHLVREDFHGDWNYSLVPRT